VSCDELDLVVWVGCMDCCVLVKGVVVLLLCCICDV
jgi:hypothetical protein